MKDSIFVAEKFYTFKFFYRQIKILIDRVNDKIFIPPSVPAQKNVKNSEFEDFFFLPF
jgi:hypothetical protein